MAAVLKPVQGLGVAERHGGLEVTAESYFRKVQHRVDQLGSTTRREVPGPRVQLGAGWFSAIGDSLHVGERDNLITIADLDMLVLILMGHGGLQKTCWGRLMRR